MDVDRTSFRMVLMNTYPDVLIWKKSESACLKMCKKLFEIGPYYLSEWLLRVEDQLEWRINKRSKANADFIDLAKDPKTKTRNNDKGIRTTLSNSNGA